MDFELSSYDSVEYLDSDEAIRAYLEEALQTDDPAFIAQALARSSVRAACRKSPRKRGRPANVLTRP